MRATCVLIVLSLNSSCAAISLFALPDAIWCSTSISRSDRMSTGEAWFWASSTNRLRTLAATPGSISDLTVSSIAIFAGVLTLYVAGLSCLGAVAGGSSARRQVSA